MASAPFANHPSRSYVYPTAPSTADAPSTSSSGPSTSTSTTATGTPSYNRYAAIPPTPAPAAPGGGKNKSPAPASLTATADRPAAPVSAVLQAFALTLALQYASAALAMPFEVAKLLLQVQYLPTPSALSSLPSSSNNKSGQPSQSQQQQPPRPDHAADDDPNLEAEDEEDPTYAGEARHWGGEFDELSDEEDAVGYFHDLSSQPLRPPSSRRGGVAGAPENNRPTDAAGYIDPSASSSTAGPQLQRRGTGGGGAGVDVDADALRPEWVLPRVWDGGVWGMMKTISRSREGILGLWKGTFASFLLEAGSSFFQPLFAQIITFLTRQPSLILSLPPSYSPSPYVSLTIQLASHLGTGLLLSPLDTVRTRLVAQSGLRHHRTYTSTWHAFSKMLNEEGGWRTAYFHPNVLIPTVLDYSLRPLLSMGTPLVIERWWGIDATNSPALYAAAELTLGTASLLVSLPIETVRRRLQLQRRAAWGALPKPVVASVRGSIPGPVPVSVPVPAAAAVTEGPTATAKPGPPGRSASSTSRADLPGFIPSHAIVGTSTLGIRTSVEVRPVAYAGVVEAMYRIVTEECGRRAHGRDPSSSSSASEKKKQKQPQTQTSVKKKEEEEEEKTQVENAIGAMSDLFGGFKSLYRGFGLAAAANGVVFVLTVVGGENARSSTGFGSGGGMGGGSFAGGGWTEI
ncbi:unnamed protein product [Tilletia laevis]|uniref:Mitochondrial carrier n=2 Tax=Tilletia TaxID=13289 RepID=A0A9N8QNG6_9BASI|nr:hypothetical protein CF336_g8827 [Tilletia laevis]KAE8262340.1 hypothetical protein A4X03_0g2528 [Tilletia caries]CAD6920548.1 unnamed protein product [Tilletia caries]CAD6966202.1 unnamed protein product [Tilletia laevis]